VTATRKITEAENILFSMQNLSDEDFQIRLDSFIKTIHEIFSHLLEEYNVKFDCKIERINLEKFKVRAKKMGKLEAINFLIWYEKEYRRIKDDSVFGYLLERDNVDVSEPNAIINSCSMLLNEIKSMTYHAYENF
jgi:CRISPR/Cas system-associated protein Cas5 (RAMP superfamily)